MGVEVSRLSNGLTVATETLPSIETVALGIWVRSGARNERENEHGMAHLLEHMAFKGTGSRSAFQIAAEIENVGGEINAATSVETTSFYARVLSDDVPLAIDILADILQDSTFDPDELEREQNVILQEIGAAHDTPDDIVFDRFTETAFHNQTIGRSILGTPDTVRSFTSRQLHDFMERQYGAEDMVVVAAGDVSHDAIVREVERKLGSFRSKSQSNTPQPAHYIGGDYREERDLMDAQVVLGFEGRAYHVRDFYASQVLSMILGGDYGFAWTPQGTNAKDIHTFVELLGFSPMEAIQAATKYGGQIMEMGDELGMIKEGYLADILLIDGDPTADVRIL